MIDYNGSVYLGNNTERYVLGEVGTKNLLIFGVNPSSATLEKDDPTMENVKKIIFKNGYNGYIMMNLFPKKTPNPDDLKDNPALREKNIEVLKIVEQTFKIDAIWCAWGDAIDKPNARKFLVESLTQIYNILRNKYEWLHYGKDLTQKGNPFHPRPHVTPENFFDWSFHKFEIDGYL